MHTRYCSLASSLRYQQLSLLQHTATHCNTLQHTATHCNTLQRTATYCNSLQRTATHCNSLQLTATHCNTLQHTATHLGFEYACTQGIACSLVLFLLALALFFLKQSLARACQCCRLPQPCRLFGFALARVLSLFCSA